MSGAVTEQEVRVTSADGIPLHLLMAVAPRPYGVLILCHGLTTDCNEHGSFPALRDAALSAGLAVVRFDFRAHGRSGGTNEHLRLAGMRADVDAVLEVVDEQLGNRLPTVPVGLSFGGAAAVHVAATRASTAGLVLWYAVVDYEWNYGERSSVPFTRQMRGASQAGLPRWSAMPILTTSYHFPSGMLAEFESDETVERFSRLTVPVLCYYASRDRFVSLDPVRRLASTRANIDLRVAHGAGHGFFLWRPWIVRRTVSWAARVARQAAS